MFSECSKHPVFKIFKVIFLGYANIMENIKEFRFIILQTLWELLNFSECSETSSTY